MSEFPPALPHGPLEEVFPDVFLVSGQFRMAPLVTITRNMIVLRNKGDLTLVNGIRLTDSGEQALAELGEVRHLIKIGAFHDRDDPYLLERYKPTFWALPRAKHRVPLTVDRELGEECELPVPDASCFVFRNAKFPEGALLVAKDDGILVTCDSVQNISSFDGMSLAAKLVVRMMGFYRRAGIGGPWRKAMQRPDGPQLREDFDRLAAQPFRHLLSGHGPALRNTAREDLQATIARVWKK